MKRIYLDNNATTAVDASVVKAMLEDLGPVPSNPSSVHSFGRDARNKLSQARQTIAHFLQTRPSEIIFTSGGSEALNMLIRGALPLGHVISSNVEHSSVYRTLTTLEQGGRPVSFLPAGPWGVVRPEAIKEALRKDTSLIVLGAVNSETGVKLDWESIARVAEERNISFIVDGVALLGKEPFTIPTGVSAMAFSAHKFHGPKGVGFAFARSSFKCSPLITGGDQESSRRAGTENLPGILGMAQAISLLQDQLPQASAHMRQLREELETQLQKRIPGIRINGEGPRTVNTSNLSCPGISGEELLMQLDLMGIAVSHGSACASSALEPSRVLTNMALPQERVRAAIRISLSRYTTQAEIAHCIEVLCHLHKRR